MRVHCVGARFYGGQVERVEAGFVELGHELVKRPFEAELVYCNDTSHCAQIIADKMRGSLLGKLIITVLDIPEHLFTPEKQRTIIEEFRYVVGAADAVCAISTFVQGQIKTFLGMDSHVVYNPIKPVTRRPAERTSPELRFLSAGRRQDFNKRFPLAVKGLQLAGITYGQLALLGEEYSPWGEHFGAVTDEQLNQFYNAVDFVIATGRIEGMGLPALEGAAAGVIPLLCNDLSTRQEFFPSTVFPEYDAVDPTPPAIAQFVSHYAKDRAAMAEMKERLYAHFQGQWASRLTGRAVAQKILDVYATLT